MTATGKAYKFSAASSALIKGKYKHYQLIYGQILSADNR